MNWKVRGSMSVESSEEIYVVVEPDGTVASLSPSAATELEQPELDDITRAVKDVVNGGQESTRVTHTAELGVLEIVRMDGEDGSTYLVEVTLVTDGPLVELTVRQREVATLAASGSSVDEIAWELDISANTVKYHLKEVYKRLGVSSRLELADELG